MGTVEMTSAVADVVTAAATLGAVLVAGFGLQAWQKELKGRADFETARAMARTTYALRDAVGYFRSPFLHGHEFPGGDMESANAYAFLYQNRWRNVGEALTAFDAAVLEAEALWGAAPQERAAALRACIVALNIATDAVVSDKRVKGQNFEVNKAFGVEMRSTIAGSPSDDKNKFSSKVRGAVVGIEELLKNHLARG